MCLFQSPEFVESPGFLQQQSHFHTRSHRSTMNLQYKFTKICLHKITRLTLVWYLKVLMIFYI